MQNIEQKLKAVDAALARWQSRLVRASNMVAKLTKKKRRLESQRGKPRPEPKPKKQLEFDIPAEPIPAEVVENVKAGLAEPKGIVAEALKVIEDNGGRIPKFLRRDPNADALKAMNKRIEQRAASRSKKPAKAKAPPRLLAKAMAERDAINELAKK